MNTMKLTFVNVGYGEAIVGECPVAGSRPFRFVIDGGSANGSEYLDRSSGRIPMPEYFRQKGIEYLDLMISTHTHEDHICAGLQAAQIAPPKELWQTLPPGFDQETHMLDKNLGQNLSQTNFLSALNDYRTLCETVRSHGGIVRQAVAGACFAPCPGLTIQVLSPNREREAELETRMRELYSADGTERFLKNLTDLDGRMNNFSLILLLDWHGTKILLPGDTNRCGYEGIASDDLRADLFKVGHHGQIDGADEKLLEKVQPRAVVCCASSDRRYNSAHPDLMRQIAERGTELYFSDCPPVPEMAAHPHSELIFTVGESGHLEGHYA